MSGGVFICYRREDSAGFARLIYDRLTNKLGRENVFFDVDNIPAGLDFVDILSERVGKCDALIAVIGKAWVSSADVYDRRRLDDPDDFVRIEIEAALERKIHVIPVLVDGASMPRPDDLPDSLKKLTRRQGIEISHSRFDSDAERLTRALSALDEVLRQREPTEAKRRAREKPEAAEPGERDLLRGETRAAGESPQEPNNGLVKRYVWAADSESRQPIEEQWEPRLTAPKYRGRIATAWRVVSSDWRLVATLIGAAVVLLAVVLPKLAPSNGTPTTAATAPITRASPIAPPAQYGPATPLAQYEIGSNYYFGRGGLKEDYQLERLGSGNAPTQTTPSAPNGSQGQYEMGDKYFLGLGVKEDLGQAISWYRKAAEQGYAAAQLRLGSLYERGLGVSRDDGQAKAWYQKAADQGNMEALTGLNRLGASIPNAPTAETTRTAADGQPERVAPTSPSKVAAAAPATQPTAKTVSPLPPLLIASALQRPGRIYKLENDNLSEFYVRTLSVYYGNGTLYSVAVSSEGVVYFADANGYCVFMLDKDRVEQCVYKHSTYVRHLAFDTSDHLYFSESSGAGGDGTIFRLDNGQAVPFYAVHLAEVDDFWAGTFAFDKNGDLWLSSGNRAPASLYKVVDGHPRRKFSSPDPILGLRFTPDGDLLYATGHTIRRLQLPGFIESVAYSNDLLRFAWDVEVIRAEP